MGVADACANHTKPRSSCSPDTSHHGSGIQGGKNRSEAGWVGRPARLSPWPPAPRTPVAFWHSGATPPLVLELQLHAELRSPGSGPLPTSSPNLRATPLVPAESLVRNSKSKGISSPALKTFPSFPKEVRQETRSAASPTCFAQRRVAVLSLPGSCAPGGRPAPLSSAFSVGARAPSGRRCPGLVPLSTQGSGCP